MDGSAWAPMTNQASGPRWRSLLPDPPGRRNGRPEPLRGAVCPDGHHQDWL